MRFNPGKLSSSKKKPKKVPKNGSCLSLKDMGPTVPISMIHPKYQMIALFTPKSIQLRHKAAQQRLNVASTLSKYKLYKDYADKIRADNGCLMCYLSMDQKIKYKLRKFVKLWIYKKYSGRFLNTVDPATLSEPVKPIQVFDTRLRGTYIFEASTIKKVFDQALVYCEWMFPCPQNPKNPLTNIPFGEGQRLAIASQLRKYDMGSQFLEAYRAHRWNLKNYSTFYSVPIKLEYLKGLLRNTSSEETIEYFTEFLEEHYEYHDVRFKGYLNILKWGLLKMNNDPYMKEWMRVFEKYHEILIVHGVDYFHENEVSHIIYNTTRRLFDKYADLARLGRERLLTAQ